MQHPTPPIWHLLTPQPRYSHALPILSHQQTSRRQLLRHWLLLGPVVNISRQPEFQPECQLRCYTTHGFHVAEQTSAAKLEEEPFLSIHGIPPADTHRHSDRYQQYSECPFLRALLEHIKVSGKTFRFSNPPAMLG